MWCSTPWVAGSRIATAQYLAVLAMVDEAVILEAGRRLAALKALLAVDPETPP